VIVAGVDPGLQRTGYGILRQEGNSLGFIACGVIRVSAKDPLPIRLHHLHQELARVMALYRPDVAAVEETFVNVNGQATLKLGQARGAILLTLALAGFEIHEYAATLVKKTVTGNGRAEKGQVARMVRYLLPAFDEAANADATDALAIALCHAQHRHFRAISGAIAGEQVNA
jgi:crossover junction endodeoxyribonuclease RuvC